jgi:prepilin-type N-terminal cleavage/methylation domain-containing protein
MRGRPVDRERGFSLLEVLCAMTILVIGLAALAQLLTLSTRVNHSAKTTTVATVVAAQKMEEMLSDTGLSPSPADSLKRNTSGYCDFVDRSGRQLGSGPSPPGGTVYIRRWSAEPLPADPANTLVLQVLVTARTNRGVDDTAGVRRLPDEARLISLKTRKAK